MSIESELYLHLKNDTDLNTLVSGRVYPNQKPQNGQVPYLVYFIVNDKDDICMGGSAYQQDVRVQIDCYSKSYSNVKAIKDATKNALYSFKHALNNLSNRDLFEDETELYRQLIDFKIKG